MHPAQRAHEPDVEHVSESRCAPSSRSSMPRVPPLALVIGTEALDTAQMLLRHRQRIKHLLRPSYGTITGQLQYSYDIARQMHLSESLYGISKARTLLSCLIKSLHGTTATIVCLMYSCRGTVFRERRLGSAPTMSLESL